MLMKERLEHYDLLGELASGGMATVYLGRQRSGTSSHLVAIKSMRQELAEDDAFLAMFLDEATLTSKIKHANVVPTLDVVSAGGRLLIVMEYVEGISLAKLLEIAWRQKVPIPPAVSIGILCDVLRGLHAAHELTDGDGRALSVVHRDVSPQNILIGTDGAARILDFGIAKAATQQHVTARGEIKGKLAYMPPEQQLAEGVDRRSDVYAAGVVLWEMLAGRRLFSAWNEEELVRQVFEGRVDPPSMLAPDPLPPDLDRAVLRALARKREDRWWTAEEMAKALAAIVPPATKSEIANLLATLGRDDLEQRAAHVRDLEEQREGHRRLAPEAQIVLDVLTGRRHQKVRPLTEGVVVTTIEPSHAGDRAEKSRSDQGRDRERRDQEREARRRARRIRTISILGGIGLAIVLLMGLALVWGMNFRRP